MSRTAGLVVRFAARLLPSPMRETYREQWLADLRDAPELGVRPSEIAVGSIAFALAAPRSGDARRRSPNVVGRSRLASALALSAAVLCMSDQLGNGPQGLTSNDLYNLVIFLGTAFLYLYMLVAPIAAVALAAFTRGMPARVRVAVALYVLASLAGVAHAVMNGIRRSAPLGTIGLAEAAAFFTAGAVLIGIGCVLTVSREAVTAKRRTNVRAGLVALLALGVALALGLANALSLRAQLHAADVKFVQDVLVANHTDGAAAMLVQSNQATITAIAVWVGSALIATLAAAWLAYVRPAHAVSRALAVLFAMMVTHRALLTFVWLNSFGGPGVHLTVPEAVLLVVGRWGLVAVILYAVGGLRLTRVRHRHDVEGAVELL